MEVCAYCGEPKGERLSCCGENHWVEVDEDDEALDARPNGWGLLPDDGGVA